MAVMVPLKVDLNAKPEEVVWRRTFIPTGQVGEFAETGLSRWVNFDGTPGSFNVGKEFTDAELDVIRKTPFLAARIEASSQVPTPIGYRDSYKNRASRLDARQIYNYATKNPLEFLKSELPAYLGAGDPEAATLLIQEIKNAGEPVENLQKLYEDALEKAPQYTETSSQYAARQYVENRGSSDPIGGFLKKYIIPIATTAGAIAGGPVGAAVANSIAQLSETGKVDPVQTAIAAGTASLAQPGTSTAVGETIGLTGQAADIAGGALLGAGISTAAGGDPLKGAISGAIGSIGSTTYATDVGTALGATGAAAPVVGNAVINSALSGIAAAATGGNVEKSMFTGAISGAATASAKEVAEAILGADNIASIADTTGLSKSQVENVFTTSIANGVIAEVQGTGEFLETVGTSLAAQGVGAKSANLMTEATAKALEDSPAIRASVITATGGIATVATNAAIQGEDVGKALENAAPGIILSSVQAGQREADRQEELAAQREKELVAAQQPLQVAGPVAPALTDLDIALQLAEGRNESVVNLGQQDGVDSYLVTGKRDDGSTYTYTILSSPEIGVKYEYTTLPLDPISLRAIPGAAMGTTVSSEAPDFRIDPTIGVPSTQQLAKLDTAQDFEYLPSQLRLDLTQTIVRNELDRLERELQQLQESQQAFQRAQTQFTGIQERGLGQELRPEVRESLEEELAGLEEEAQRAGERAGQIESERATLTGIESGEQELSDEQLLSFLETGEVPAGITGGRREGEGEAPEGGLEAGESEEGGAGRGENGEGEGAGGEGEGEGGAGVTETRLRPSLIFDRTTGGRTETTPFASRVTGEALASILGEKQPLFGGDEDEQRAVWNRRSLRLLSRALGL